MTTVKLMLAGLLVMAGTQTSYAKVIICNKSPLPVVYAATANKNVQTGQITVNGWFPVTHQNCKLITNKSAKELNNLYIYGSGPLAARTPVYEGQTPLCLTGPRNFKIVSPETGACPQGTRKANFMMNDLTDKKYENKPVVSFTFYQPTGFLGFGKTQSGFSYDSEENLFDIIPSSHNLHQEEESTLEVF